jgi:sulfur-carrier protein
MMRTVAEQGGAAVAVHVRLFAAVREAAGTDEIDVDGDRLEVVLVALRSRFGEPFSSRLGLCSVLVDGDAVPRDADVPLRDGAEVVLLPPVSGGATRLRRGWFPSSWPSG